MISKIKQNDWCRDSYIPSAERIVRNALSWLNDEGRLIDPYQKEETPTATARFVGALGLLMLSGHCHDMEETCAKALTPALEDLYYNRTDWGEFITKEAIMAYWYLKDKAPEAKVKKWTKMLSDYDPEKWYYSTRNGIIEHNYVTFAIAGEALKRKLGLADNLSFIDTCIEKQLQAFDENGMYHDPGCPMTYDMVARMNLSLALWAGYDGKYHETLSEILYCGAMSQLYYQSPTGECPFGGRSNQQNFNEITFAVISEFQATREYSLGNCDSAKMMKQSAFLAFKSIEKYLYSNPVYFTKNFFPQESQHGRQKGYGFYGAYSLLIASQLGFAWLVADDEVPLEKCPAEKGGVLFVTDEGFHKIFATTGGYHVEIDLNADPDYDATGLGRVHVSGFPADIALSAPITASPSYLTIIPPAKESIAIGPSCDGKFLANLNGEKLKTKLTIDKQNEKEVCFTVIYYYDNEMFVSEKYAITASGINILAHTPNASEMVLRVPLLKTNGKDQSVITCTDTGFILKMKQFEYSVKCLNSNPELAIENFEVPNRNGIYKVGLIKTVGETMNTFFSAKCCMNI